jgi:hypothetical protein
MAAGRLDAAGRLLEESVRLRRDIGFGPGVAAGILALAELAACRGDRDQAAELLDEAARIAAEAGAAGVGSWQLAGELPGPLVTPRADAR